MSIYLRRRKQRKNSDGGYLLAFRQQKTSEQNYLNLPEQALIYTGVANLRTAKVLTILKTLPLLPENYFFF